MQELNTDYSSQDDAPADHRKVDRRGKVAHRLSYTLEQEVQIWKVFLEEYKAGNAEVKAKTKWKVWSIYIYKHEPQGSKTVQAIEAHFRRKMLPRIWSFRRHLPMEDFQILLRFFKVKLTKKQVRRLEDNFKYTIALDPDRRFLKAIAIEKYETNRLCKAQVSKTQTLIFDSEESDCEEDQDTALIVPNRDIKQFMGHLYEPEYVKPRKTRLPLTKIRGRPKIRPRRDVGIQCYQEEDSVDAEVDDTAFLAAQPTALHELFWESDDEHFVAPPKQSNADPSYVHPLKKPTSISLHTIADIQRAAQLELSQEDQEDTFLEKYQLLSIPKRSRRPSVSGRSREPLEAEVEEEHGNSPEQSDQPAPVLVDSGVGGEQEMVHWRSDGEEDLHWANKAFANTLRIGTSAAVETKGSNFKKRLFHYNHEAEVGLPTAPQLKKKKSRKSIRSHLSTQPSTSQLNEYSGVEQVEEGLVGSVPYIPELNQSFVDTFLEGQNDWGWPEEDICQNSDRMDVSSAPDPPSIRIERENKIKWIDQPNCSNQPFSSAYLAGEQNDDDWEQ